VVRRVQRRKEIRRDPEIEKPPRDLPQPVAASAEPLNRAGFIALFWHVQLVGGLLTMEFCIALRVDEVVQ
jgi:hypothetical protein